MAWFPGNSRNQYTYQDVVYYYMNSPASETPYTSSGPNSKYDVSVNLGYGSGGNHQGAPP